MLSVVPPMITNQREMANLLEQEYPPELIGSGTSGTIQLRLFVSAQGEVERSLMHESSGSRALDRAAMRVAYRLQFRPAVQGDCTVAVWVGFPIGFTAG